MDALGSTVDGILVGPTNNFYPLRSLFYGPSLKFDYKLYKFMVKGEILSCCDMIGKEESFTRLKNSLFAYW